MVPELFEGVSISRPVFFKTEPLAQQWGRFCPNLDIPQYREPLSEEKKTELDKRAAKLYKRAVTNQLYKSSEFGWEVCAWHDVFGLIMDDKALRMFGLAFLLAAPRRANADTYHQLRDKRPYEYAETDEDGQRLVKLRIPDATLGLTAYDTFDFNFSREHVCPGPDCDVDHKTKPDERLSQDRLMAMMHNHECGLVVDGSWGNADIVFPFAAYEAKKRAISYEAAKEQIHDACRAYLAMLDDLARNPDNVAEYQTKDSSKYQLFAFTSCGSYWEVYLAWNFLNRCVSLNAHHHHEHRGIPLAYAEKHVETIWEGDVKDFSRAFDLICIVDQIQDYAINTHRPFVMQHLEAWHARHEKSFPGDPEESSRATIHGAGSSDMGPGTPSGENPDNSGQWINIESILELIEKKKPEWLRLKDRSKARRRNKAQMTRGRKEDLRELGQERQIMDASPQPAQAKTTNKVPKHGHPRKAGNKVVKAKVAERSFGGTRRSARLRARATTQ